MVSGDRQRIIETNRSLRIIKNELETLLEKGVLTDNAYDSISALLPPESSLSGSHAAVSPAPVPSIPTPQAAAARAVLPVHTKAPTPVHEPAEAHPPPAYSAAGAMPQLPPRKAAQAPPDPPAKPVLCRARAQYKYAAQDSRDCSFDKDDVIEVYEYMNADWWMGRNSRTGAEGIFPRNYVEPIVDEKSPGGPPPVTAAVGGAYPAPPPQGAVAQNPYNSSVPPMAVAEGSGGAQGGQAGDNKGKEMGKKFGKKLGNAAIFGAGATIGSNIVNSIF